MMIVDGQIHIWNEPPRPSSHHLREVYPKEQALAEMDAAGVCRAILHPARQNADSRAYQAAAAQLHPDRFAVMGWFPPERPEYGQRLAEMKAQPGMLGLRFVFNEPHEQSWPTDGTLDWLWVAAERAQIPIALRALTWLPTVGQIAERHPGLKLIVDHMAAPQRTKGDAAYIFQPELLALAKHPNIAVKATGQPGYAEDDYPFRSIHEHLHRVFDAFGPERMFWGSDITRMSCSWRQCATLFTEELPWLKGRDLELVMGRAICDWLGWRLPE